MLLHFSWLKFIYTKTIIMKRNIFLLTFTLLILGFTNVSYGQSNKGRHSTKSKKSKTSCIIIDAQNCCDGTNEVPKCIAENSTLAIKVLNVNPFKTTVSASGVTSVIDFGNDSLFSFNFTPVSPSADSEVKENNIRIKESTSKKGKAKDTCCKALDSIKKAVQLQNEEANKRIKECTKKISDALEQLTLLNRAEKQLQRLFDTTFVTKGIFTKRMWSILECIGITNICECKTKTDSCCNCSAHKKYKELYASLNAGYECIKDQYKQLGGEKKKTETFSLSGKLLDKDKGVTVDVKDAKGSFDVKEENEMKPFFDNLTQIINKANSDSVKNALLLNAEFIDDCISKLCNDTATEFYQQNYIKGPIEGDYITVTPFIKKLNGDTIKLKDFPAYKIRICGGFRANVSSGISFSFFGMVDDDFTIARSDRDSQFVIKKTDKGTNLYIPSLTSFLHFYTRGCSSLQSAATLGLSVNPTSLESLKVMAGYSLIFGDERRGGVFCRFYWRCGKQAKNKIRKRTKALDGRSRQTKFPSRRHPPVSRRRRN